MIPSINYLAVDLKAGETWSYDPPAGHTWTYRLAPDGDGTRVTLTYDWSEITDPEMLKYFPVMDADALSASLDLLAQALA